MERLRYEAAHNDSRYIPFTQQGYCCVPTSIQMIMYRNGIPLVPAEEIGYHLGLTVPPEDADLFFNVRTSEEPPADSGFGTQIQFPEYEPNQALQKLQIPLFFSQKLSSAIESSSRLLKILQEIEDNNSDALLCFNHGVIRGEYQPNSGHVVVFDKLVGNDVQVVDASPRNSKWRTLDIDTLFDAIRQHGDDNAGGVWHFTRQA